MSPTPPPGPTVWGSWPNGQVGSDATQAASRGRNGAFLAARRDLGIPGSEQPTVRRVMMTDRNGAPVLDANKNPLMTREYVYARPDGSIVVIQDHGAGHYFGEGEVGGQGPHFNVRPSENTRTGHVPGTEEHY